MAATEKLIALRSFGGGSNKRELGAKFLATEGEAKTLLALRWAKRDFTDVPEPPAISPPTRAIFAKPPVFVQPAAAQAAQPAAPAPATSTIAPAAKSEPLPPALPGAAQRPKDEAAEAAGAPRVPDAEIADAAAEDPAKAAAKAAAAAAGAKKRGAREV